MNEIARSARPSGPLAFTSSSNPLPTARDLAGAIFRQKKIVLAVVLLILAAGCYYMATYPRYESQAIFMLERDRVDPLVTPEQTSNPQMLRDTITEEQVHSEAALLKSEDLLRAVVDRCGLADSPSGSSETPEVRTARAVRRLGKQLHVSPVRKTNIIEISYASSSPELSQKVVETVTSLYLAKHAEVHRPGAQVEFFERQADKYKQAWNRAKQQLAGFTAQTHVVAASLERDGTLQQRIAFSQSLATTEADAQKLRHTISLLEQQLSTLHPRMVTQEKKSDNGTLLQQLKSTLLTQQLKRLDLLAIYQPNHRLVQDLDREIAQTQAAIATELAAPVAEQTTDQDPAYELVRENLLKAKTDLAATEAKADALRTITARYQTDAQSLNERSLQQDSLQQEEKLQQANYLLYAQKAEEARITAALDERRIVNVVVAQPASLPVLPRHSLAALIALTLLGATVLGIGFGFVADLFDPTFQHPDQLQAYLGVPVLVSFPGTPKPLQSLSNSQSGRM